MRLELKEARVESGLGNDDEKSKKTK
jgi:hypothetical protein